MSKSTQLIVPETYAELERAVLAVVHKSRREVDWAWLMTFHETGRLIHVHLLFKRQRATYGAQVYADLAAATGTSSRSLHEFVQFYRTFPIVRDRAQLGWSHYRLLCQVADPAQRNALLAETIKRGWVSPELERRVRALALAKPDAADAARNVTPAKLLTPKRGTPGVCQVIDTGDGPGVDLGFASYRDLPPATGLRAGGLVRWDAAGRIAAAASATKADLFTYAAVVRKVVDGDTLWVKIYLEPGRWVKQKLRLRDLDCPELVTPEGRAAKRFVEALLAKTKSVTVTTTKPDKYDRYLADVFFAPASGDEVFLNNALLAHGHAVRKEEWEFRDWEKDWFR